MKISKLFHWLYASIMFLPLLVIPIFAIYSQRHVIDNNSVTIVHETIDEVEYESFQYCFYQDVEMYDSDYLLECFTDSFISFELNRDYNYPFNVEAGLYYDFIAEHKYAIIFDESLEGFNIFFDDMFGNSAPYGITESGIYVAEFTDTYYPLYVGGRYAGSFATHCNMFDLTDTFGVGNEPTLDEFLELMEEPYYEYGNVTFYVTDSVTESITYGDTDIGSQFIYQMYNVTDKYFNIKNWMNLNPLYDWFISNIFNGSNSLVLPVIFNLITYWLVISFLWLIFDILMYVPSMIHKMLDKARME